jgi:23S rRNA (guanine2445-N2)-methyltransferase / 23S rRNA (guanine2069-N7)-methyltransferase
VSAFLNRLRKNLETIGKQAERLGVEAYRVYDREIPEYPLQVDLYGTQDVLLHDRRNPEIDFSTEKLARWQEVLVAIDQLLPGRNVVVKERRPKSNRTQYERQGEHPPKRLVMREGPLRFWVDLQTYLDTGLFLDHRRVRGLLAEGASRSWPSGLVLRERVLNLFCYTGSLSVAAVKGGFRSSVSVDLSQTYLDWAKDNFKLNEIDISSKAGSHRFVQADVLQHLRDAPSTVEACFDLILLDPPTFSRSARMAGTLDIQRDHVRLLEMARPWLRRGAGESGILFSTNLRDFRLDRGLHASWQVRELSKETLPFDFRDPKTRSVFWLAPIAAAAGQSPGPR